MGGSIAGDYHRLRELGKAVAEIAADPANVRNERIWTAVNDGVPGCPAVLARDYPMYAIDYGDELAPRCADPFLRSIESSLLLAIYEWRRMRCHRVVEDVVYCPVAYVDRRYGIWQSSPYTEGFRTAVAFGRQIGSIADLGKIKDAEVTYDEAETDRRLGMLREAFAGVLRVKLHGVEHFNFAPWDELMQWMGIERGMADFHDDPGLMHAAMARYVEVSVQRARICEGLGILSSNNRNVAVSAGGYGYTSRLPRPTEGGIGARLIDNWGDGRDQILTAVSPEMQREFAFGHEGEWAGLFGLSYYGCCEDMGGKVGLARESLPRLRKVTAVAFAKDLEGIMEACGKDLAVSYKPNPNYLATSPWPRDLMRAELVGACGMARRHGCAMEILMKTIITLDGDPSRLWDWCAMAVDVAENY
ncbi:MAG: hypothetical protein FWE70_04440 [Oscillospiraceae bacterium]|nr:hypothetical protein [Oscillospiraceae bacterium]